MGSDFARTLRGVALQEYKDLYRTYGPRSFRYAEMVFGNTLTVNQMATERPQARIYAMRTSRVWPLAEIARRAGISTDEVKRYNPAIVRQVVAHSDLYPAGLQRGVRPQRDVLAPRGASGDARRSSTSSCSCRPASSSGTIRRSKRCCAASSGGSARPSRMRGTSWPPRWPT